jgi:ACS family hexuronate transporter-like MFS transporter
MSPTPTASPASRGGAWKWWICGLLLLASTINYMDRQTLANAAVRITRTFQLSQEQYGSLELGFGWAFAAGSIVMGYLADRISIRWLYPAFVMLWSVTGFATGLVGSYTGLLTCRVLLGFFEAGHWPCAIKTTQRMLEPKDRSLGNSVLQSGTSIGAIITPLVLRALMTDDPQSWRPAFQIVALSGLIWIVGWFALVRSGDLTHVAPPRDSVSIWHVLASRRMVAILLIIAFINTGWQLLRAWLPKFLQEGRGYDESTALYFNAAFFVATDVGCLGAGALTWWLHRRGVSVHRSRTLVFLACSVLAALTIAAALLPKGSLLLAVLLVVGAGALGVFPIYHAFTQDLSPHHQGKISGAGGVAAFILSPAHTYFGRLIDRTGSFDLGIAIAGCLPLLACVVLATLWTRRSDPTPTPA